MGVSAEIRHATLDDVEMIAPLLRQADKDEIEAASGLTPRTALELSLRLCDEPVIGFMDGQPASIWGVNTGCFVQNRGVPWMLGTPLLDRYPKTWLPIAAAILKDMRDRYTLLENYVDARNKKSIRWLKRLGFQFEKAQPYGVHGLHFHKFWIEGE